MIFTGEGTLRCEENGCIDVVRVHLVLLNTGALLAIPADQRTATGWVLRAPDPGNVGPILGFCPRHPPPQVLRAAASVIPDLNNVVHFKPKVQ